MNVMELAFLFSIMYLVQLALCNDCKLELVSVVHRHGDRSPITSFPKSEHPISYWPQGPGQLTKTGMQQAYHLGEILRKRYIDTGFIYNNYTREQVYVRSTDADRTLMTAQCVLANMFTPELEQQFTNGLQWQPIPVHTVSLDNEILLRSHSTYCPTYATLRKDDYNTQEYMAMESDNQDFFSTLEHDVGGKVNLSGIWSLEDALFIEFSHNLTGNYSWFNTDLLKRLSSLSNYLLSLFYNSEEKMTITGGVWADKVLNDMQFKAEQKDNDPSKLFLYSAHDTTVASMLSVFSMYNGIQPQYTSAYIIELCSLDGEYFVEFYYRNQTSSDNIVELFHPDCKPPCSLNQLTQAMKSYALTENEWKVICGISNGTSQLSGVSEPTVVGLSVTVAFLAIVSTIVTIVLIVLIILHYKRPYMHLKETCNEDDEDL